jgi:hypothetical protein
MENNQLEKPTQKRIFVPKDMAKYTGQYIVFFSDKKDPEILFISAISEEAYKKADEIRIEKKKTPVVLRVIPEEAK